MRATASDDDAEFVSAAEHFIAADEDGSGALDVEELAQATGTSLEEATLPFTQRPTPMETVVTPLGIHRFTGRRENSILAQTRRPGSPSARTAPTNAPTHPFKQPPPSTTPAAMAAATTSARLASAIILNSRAGRSSCLRSKGGLVHATAAPLVQPTIRSGVHCRNCGIDWTLTGVSARCAVSKTWAIDAASMGKRPVFEEHGFVKPHAGGFA